MIEKNKIENLFQEKLNNFEVHPPDEVWMNIENELNKKKEKRRVIPFWWKLSGIAALLVIGYSIYDAYLPSNLNNTLESNKNSIVNAENASSKKTTSNTISKEGENQIVSSENSTPNVTDSENVISNKKAPKNTSNTNSVDAFVTKKEVKNQAVASNKKAIKNKISLLKEAVAQQTKSQKENAEKEITNQTTYSEKTLKDNLSTTNENKTIVDGTSIHSQVEKNNLKKQLEVESKEEANKKIDSAIANAEIKTMEELLKEKENTQKQKINRWLVTPTIAPIYFGSFKNGSPIDESLSSNQKTYNNSVSYGLSLSYVANPKVKIRAGINVLNLDYDTHGIVFYQDTKAEMMKNIKPTLQGSLIQIKPLNNVETLLDRVVSERFDGVLNQKLGYIEMPIEMTYNLFGRKFGVDLSGGFSTLFLNTNEIYLKSDGLNMKIGSASNLNNIHFSTNLGLGLNYSVFKNFSTRIEPTFKYQINTFSSDSESFKPYLFGIYSGISYKF
ncbi:MAG: outer membrane beta-barrel protein [Flavobacterium sp.]|nr:outer membrane beta-barrel protein [Flavobacterium sp.]